MTNLSRFLSILGYIFFSEIPRPVVILGGLLIIISGIYIVYREHIKNKQLVKEGIIKDLN